MIPILTAPVTDVDSIIKNVKVTDHQPLSVEVSLLKDKIHTASIILDELVSHTFLLIVDEFCVFTRCRTTSTITR